MNELNKLIQQYEKENPGKKVKDPFFDEWEDEFVEWLVGSFTNSFDHMNSQIKSLQSRPTCGKEQRLFLDEVEQAGIFVNEPIFQGVTFPQGSVLDQDDYDADLQKVVKGE